jgi:hypothetical protein
MFVLGMGRNNASIGDRKYVKEGIKADMGQFAPSVFILALRALRVLRRVLGVHSRVIEVLLAIDTLCERNEGRNGEYMTCKAEIDTILKGALDEKTLGYTLASLRASGYLLAEDENTRWSYNTYNYSLTVSGKDIVKQYYKQLEALQIELNTAKVRR